MTEFEKIENAVTDQPEATPDPFDPERLKLTQDFATSIGVKKALINIPVKRPSKEWWIHTHPDEKYRLETGILELREDNEIYLVDPELWESLSTEPTFSPRALFLSVNRQGVLFLWPIRLPGPDGKIDDWNRSALEIALMATEGWVRVASNRSLGAYEVHTTRGAIPSPEWPDIPLRDILRIAFKECYIDDLEHPVLKKLRGEI